MRLRRRFSLVVAAVVLGAIAFAAVPFVSKLGTATAADIPTARVTRGPLETRVYAVGEIRPANVSMVMAPPAGGMLQIIYAAGTGTYVNEGDVVVEFDPVEQEYNLEQARSQLEEAEQQIRKLQADIAVRKAQDDVALLGARFNVRRAELRIKENDLLSAIEARKNVISLAEAKRRLEQMERDVKSRASSDQADLALQNVNRSRAMMQMKLAQQNIDNMKLRAPIGGIVVMAQSYGVIMMSSGGGIYENTTEYREGDQVAPGMTVAQIQDVEQMEVASKVSEVDRGSLTPGQPIDVRVDSYPMSAFTGKVKFLAGMASTSTQTAAEYYAGTKSFDATFEFDARDMRMNPGASARIEVRGTNAGDTLSVPRQALFSKAGKPVVYVKRAADNWDALEIQIKYLTESRAAVEGLAEGTEVALIDPSLPRADAGAKGGPLGSILRGAAR